MIRQSWHRHGKWTWLLHDSLNKAFFGFHFEPESLEMATKSLGFVYKMRLERVRDCTSVHTCYVGWHQLVRTECERDLNGTVRTECERDVRQAGQPFQGAGKILCSVTQPAGVTRWLQTRQRNALRELNGA